MTEYTAIKMGFEINAAATGLVNSREGKYVASKGIKGFRVSLKKVWADKSEPNAFAGSRGYHVYVLDLVPTTSESKENRKSDFAPIYDGNIMVPSDVWSQFNPTGSADMVLSYDNKNKSKAPKAVRLKVA